MFSSTQTVGITAVAAGTIALWILRWREQAAKEAAQIGCPSDPPKRPLALAALTLATSPDVFDATLKFFTEGPLRFKVLEIFPADAPREALITGHGCRLRLQPSSCQNATPATIEIYVMSTTDVRTLVAPNGTICSFRLAIRPVEIPPLPQLELEHTRPQNEFGLGRAGMTYRELLPSRAGGALVASHIRVASNGPVSDYVHFHRVRFQMIYCIKGWAKLVYEDFGPPTIMKPGDCVLQPPTIRHQVLESGGSLEVVEISCPAEHETIHDPDMCLPTTKIDSSRSWHQQRFSWHRCAEASWVQAGVGWLLQDLGTGDASGGIGVATTYIASSSGSTCTLAIQEESVIFFYLVCGQVDVKCSGTGAVSKLEQNDSLSLSHRNPIELTSTAETTRVLVVTMPITKLSN